MPQVAHQPDSDSLAVRHPGLLKKGAIDTKGRFIAPVGLVVDIPTYLIVLNPTQPREEIEPEEFVRLEASILAEGILKPVEVMITPSGSEITNADGGTRLTIAKKHKLRVVPCRFIKYMEGAELLLHHMKVNNHRSAHKYPDLGKAFQRVMREKGWNVAELARNSQFAAAFITKCINLLDLGPEPKKELAIGRLNSDVMNVIAGVESFAQQDLCYKAVLEEAKKLIRSGRKMGVPQATRIVARTLGETAPPDSEFAQKQLKRSVELTVSNTMQAADKLLAMLVELGGIKIETLKTVGDNPLFRLLEHLGMVSESADKASRRISPYVQ